MNAEISRSLPDHLPVKVITPQTGLQGLLRVFRGIWSGLPQARQLAWRFFLRDTRAAHRQSLLGYFWLIVPPLANTLVWVFLNNQKVIQIDSGNVAYPIFVLCGTILWGAFNGSLVTILGTVNEAKGVLAKVNFPQEALCYSALLKSLLDAVIPMLLLIPAALFFKVAIQPKMLLFVPALLSCILIGAGIGVMLVPLASLYSDVTRGVQLILRFGFFFTPVIFPVPVQGVAKAIMSINPISPLIVSGRSWFTGTNEATPVEFIIVLGGGLVLLILGVVLLKAVLPHIIERISP